MSQTEEAAREALVLDMASAIAGVYEERRKNNGACWIGERNKPGEAAIAMARCCLSLAQSRTPTPSRDMREALAGLLPYAKASVPYPISVGEPNVIERAESLLRSEGAASDGGK